jgi:tetratricopeptide (TPR) repeat protein
MRPSKTIKKMVWKSIVAGMFVAAAFAFASPSVAKCADQNRPTNQAMYSYMTKGINEAQAGKIDLADQTWRAAYQVIKTDCYAVYPWAQDIVASLEQGKPQRALDNFGTNDLHSMYVDIGADKPYLKGLAAFKRGDFPTAATEFQDAIRLSDKALGQSRFPQADFALGVAFFASDKRAEAVRQWRLTLSDRWPAVPQADLDGPDGVWLAALELYAAYRVPPLG